MFKLTYEDCIENEKTSEKFKTLKSALAKAKREYFNPNDDWYADQADCLPDDIKTVEELAELDYKAFCNDMKFNFDDGMHIVGVLTVE